MVIKSEDGLCHFCGKKVSADYYCYGCGCYICSECEIDDPPMGEHDITDHDPAGENTQCLAQK